MKSAKDQNGLHVHVGDQVLTTINEIACLAKVTKIYNTSVQIEWDAGYETPRVAKVPCARIKKFTVKAKDPKFVGEDNLTVLDAVTILPPNKWRGNVGRIQTFYERGARAMVIFLDKRTIEIIESGVLVENLRRATEEEIQDANARFRSFSGRGNNPGGKPQESPDSDNDRPRIPLLDRQSRKHHKKNRTDN